MGVRDRESHRGAHRRFGDVDGLLAAAADLERSANTSQRKPARTRCTERAALDLVETWRLELQTSALQTRRSTN